MIGEQVSIGELTLFPGNPRRGDIAAIAESLERNGQYQPIVVDADGRVLAGNHTLQAAQSLGWTSIYVVRVDVDDETARRIVLADNRISDLATYDDAALLSLLAELPDLEGTAFSDADIATLRRIVEDLLDTNLPAPATPRPAPEQEPGEGGGEEPEVDLRATITLPRIDPIVLSPAEAAALHSKIVSATAADEDVLRTLLRMNSRSRGGSTVARLGAKGATTV